MTPPTLSVNALARPLVERLVADATALGIAVGRGPGGITLIDAGIDTVGSVEAGLRIGEICMGGLGRVQLRTDPGPWPAWLEVQSAQPVLACLASQYAGWSLAATKEETGGKKFFALGSGPARALSVKEPLFDELGYRDVSQTGVLVMEVDRMPPQVIVDKLLHDCGLDAAQLTVIVTPTRSLAGTTQVVARVLEVALHRAHELHFPLANIVGGSGIAPLPAPSPDGVEAMGRTNDAILYGGRVQLQVRGDDDAARELAQRLPSSNSGSHGTSFTELFKAANYDFYQLDPCLFAPAEVWVFNIDTGNSWKAGAPDLVLLGKLWSGTP